MITILSMSSCARIVPVTNQIIEQVGGKDQLEKFQYYVSKKIKMERTEKTVNADVIRGKANVIDYTLESSIIIRKSTPGVVIRSRYGGGRFDILAASFTDSDERFLQFSNFGSSNSDAPYYLISMEGQKSGQPGGSHVIYDNAIYSYKTSGRKLSDLKILSRFRKNKSINEPKLLIKLKKKDLVEKKRRREKGREVEF
jgi:hypothetical protein